MESPSTLLIFVVIAASIGLFGVALLGMVDIFKRRKEKVASFRSEPSTESGTLFTALTKAKKSLLFIY
jgi:formiminotetrahydrofolate cyclodeaminase